MNPYIYAGLVTSANKENNVTIEHLFKVVEEVTGVDRKQIESNSRLKEIVHARKIIGLFCNVNLEMGTAKAGKVIKRDHSTICHYLKDYDGLMKYDKIFKAKYDKVLKRMHDKNMINYGVGTVKSMCIEIEAEKEIQAIRNRKYL